MQYYSGNTYTLVHMLGNANTQRKKYTCICDSCENRRKPILYRKPRLPLTPLTLTLSEKEPVMKKMLSEKKFSANKIIMEKIKKIKSHFYYKNYPEDSENNENEDF